MNDAEKESIDKIAKDFVRKASSLGAYEEAHLGEDENNEPLYGDYLKLEKELADILIAKEDEIERLKEENGILSRNADDANKLCSEKHDFMLSQFKKKDEQIERLTNKLSEAEAVIADRAENRRQENIGWTKTVQTRDEKIQSLTARNKELEQALSGRAVSCEACNGMAEKVKELEAENQNFKDCYGGQCISCDVRFGSTEQSLIFKFKKTKEELESKIAVLEKNKTYYVYEGSDLEAFELNRLESKLAVAREAIESVVSKCFEPGMIDPFNDGWRWFYKCQDALAKLGEK